MMLRRRLAFILVASILPLILFGYTSCDRMSTKHDITIMGNPLTAMSVANYSQQNGNASLSEFNLCMSQIDLTPSDPSSPVIQVKFSTLQELAVPAEGVDLQALPIPNGNYVQIVLELSDQCGTQRSVGIVNSQGTYNTNQSVNLTFNGQITIDSSPKKITFGVQPIVDNLGAAASDADVATKAAQAPGTYTTTDIWLTLATLNAPSARENGMAVWTGTEMIVWGGDDSTQYLNTGGRFNPTTNTWTATSTGANVPVAQFESAFVWTGTEMIIWSGQQLLTDGSRYNPTTDSWTAMTTVNAPVARHSPATVWTGTEMIVWGGTDGSQSLNSGGRYNPTTDTWVALPTVGAPPPAAFENHNVAAVWTGTEMLVWGGDGGVSTGFVNTGGRYNPSTNSWTPIPTAGAPSARKNFTPIWTGTELIIWGGYNGVTYSDGARFNPSTNSWTPMSQTNGPDPKDTYAGVWTGTKMIVWGGSSGGAGPGTNSNTGWEYDPASDTWTAISQVNAPSPRWGPTAVWTGNQMIVWGGSDALTSSTDQYFNTGGIFLP